MGQMCMTDAGTTQDNFILPAPPVGRLPISQDWLDRMKLVHDRTMINMFLSASLNTDYYIFNLVVQNIQFSLTSEPAQLTVVVNLFLMRSQLSVNIFKKKKNSHNCL